MNPAAVHYRSLPIAERIELVEDIWDSIAEEPSVAVALAPEQRPELHRRLATYWADLAESLLWEQVRGNLFKGWA